MNIRRQDYDNYFEWRAAWSSLMESVLTKEQEIEYECLLVKGALLEEVHHRLINGEAVWNAALDDWLNAVIRRLNHEANDFYGSVMDNDAMQRNIIKAKN